MAGEVWQRRTLEQCATFLSGGTPAKSRADYWTGSIPWVSAKDLKVFRLHDAEDHVTADAIDAGSRLVPAGSIFLLVRGMTLHNDIPICVAMCEMAFNQDIKALIPKAGVDATFLTYWLLSQKPGLLRSVDSAGHGTGRLNTDTLKAMTVDLPPLAEQRAIAGVLGALDDKIELNRRMNATLESMARALFQSWFVDFDPVRAKLDGRTPVALDPSTATLFPASFQGSPVGHIPTGWELAELGQIADVIDCLHAKKPSRCENGQLYLQLNNIRDDGLIDITDSFFVSAEDYQKWISRMEALPGDCVITNVGRVGAVGQIPQGVKAALGRNITGIRSKSAFPFPTFLIECLVSESMREEIRLKTDSGTILDALNVKSIPRLRFVRPSPEIGARFESLARPLRRRMEQNLAESRTLATLRHTLLPKLLSGELSVAEREN